MAYKKYCFEFDTDGLNRITFDYSPEADEKFDTDVQEGVPCLFLNRSGMITLAQTLIKIAYGNFSDGFHVHLHKDLDADAPDRLTLFLHPDDAPPY